MKFKEPLDDILGQRVKVKILRCLVLKRMELSGRQIAEETGISPTGTHKALRDLVEAHVVAQKRTGRALLFSLNRENCLVQAMLSPLFEKEEALLKLAIDSLLKRIHAPIISLILYGSLAQKKETPRSDIDLLVITALKDKKKTEDAFDKVGSEFFKKYGRLLSPCIMSIEEFQAKYRKRAPFMVEVVKTGVVVRGKLISQILSHGR